MKIFFFTLTLALSLLSAEAGTIKVYSYDPTKLLGTEYANDFRRARQDGQPVYISVSKAKRIIKQCRPALVNKQNINTTQDNNFLNISSHGEASVQLTGVNMLMAPQAPGSL